jgi:hypothetical protein
VREFHAHLLVCAALLFYASFAWRRKQAGSILCWRQRAGWRGIEATEAIAAVHERPGRRQGPTLPARGRSVRAANGFYIASAA